MYFPPWGSRLLDESAEGGTTGDSSAAVDIGAGGAESGVPSGQTAGTGGVPDSGGDAGNASGSAAQAAAEKQAFDLFEAAKKHGYDLGQKYKDPEEAVAGLLEAQQLVGRRNADAEYGRSLRQHDAEIREWLAQKREAAAAKQQSTGEKQPEQLDPRLMLMVQLDDETGRYVPLRGAPQSAADKVNAWLEEQRDLQLHPERRLDTERERIKAELREEFQQTFEQQRLEQTADRIFGEIAGWAVNKGQDGRPLVDPATGQLSLTPQGRAYRAAATYLQGRGVTDPDLQHEMAMTILQAQANRAAGTAGAGGNGTNGAGAGSSAGKPPPAGSLRQPNITAGETVPGKPRQQSGKGLSLGEKLRRKAKEAGIPDEAIY